MNHSHRTVIALLVGTALGFSLAVSDGVQASRKVASAPPLPAADARLLAEVLQRVKAEYVDRVDDHELMQNAIRGMVSGLDPHSEFMDEEAYEDLRIATEGNYSGVGIEVSLEGGAVMVVSPIEDSPADRAGLRTGDVIIAIDGHELPVDGLDDAIARMRGKPGSIVRLTVEREQVAEPLKFAIERAEITVHSVRAELLEPGYGYVRIAQFSDNTGVEVVAAINDLRRRSPRLDGIVLDLRNNPGGLLDAAVEVSDVFLDKGIIVTANGRGPDARFEMDATPGDLLPGGRIAVLVNAGSASASEIVAGALKDNGRAVLVGRTTFGKGSVQTVLPLSDGHAIKLTTSRYYTPSGASIHEKGITPDVMVPRDQAGADVRRDDARPLEERDAEVRIALDAIRARPAQRMATKGTVSTTP